MRQGQQAAKAGLLALALTVASVSLLVVGVVAGPVAGVVAGVAALGFFAVQWVVVPLWSFRAGRHDGQ